MFEYLIDRRLESSEPLRQCQLAELHVLDVFDEICKKHGLTYWLDYGSLLGAMRHDGFIPWDDDVDVSMPEEDYYRFLKIAPSELPETMIVQDCRNIPFQKFRFAKVRELCSFFCESETVAEIPCGFFLDINRYERQSRLPRGWNRFFCWARYSFWRHYGEAMARPRIKILPRLADCLVAAVWKTCYYLFSCVYNVVRKIAPSNNWLDDTASIRHEMIPNDVIFPLTEKEFEGRMYPVPGKTDEFLKLQFGDWRKLPPPEKRRYHATVVDPTHAPKVWWAKEWKPKGRVE